MDTELFWADNAVSLVSINYLSNEVADISCCRSVCVALKNQELLEQEKEFVFERGFIFENSHLNQAELLIWLSTIITLMIHVFSFLPVVAVSFSPSISNPSATEAPE